MLVILKPGVTPRDRSAAQRSAARHGTATARHGAARRGD